jgi:aspartyl protease family protein
MDWLRSGSARSPDSGMGTFRVTIHLAGASGERFQLMEALVDTGASYTWIPRDALEELGVRPDENRVFVLADGREVRYPMAWVRVRLDERTQPTLVVCGDSGTEPLLGAFTLEGFGLGVDPVNRRLIPVPGLLKAVA